MVAAILRTVIFIAAGAGLCLVLTKECNNNKLRNEIGIEERIVKSSTPAIDIATKEALTCKLERR